MPGDCSKSRATDFGGVPQPAQAVACAIAIQAETEQAAAALDDNVKMRLRVGVHVGEVMVEGEDLVGDSVYIASRLESVTVPGAFRSLVLFTIRSATGSMYVSTTRARSA